MAKRGVEIRRARIEADPARTLRGVERSAGADALQGLADDAEVKGGLNGLAPTHSNRETARQLPRALKDAGLAEASLTNHEQRLSLARACTLENKGNCRHYAFSFVHAGPGRILNLGDDTDDAASGRA